MIIEPSHRIATVEEYYFSTKLKHIAQMRAQGAEIINLGIGSPDLPPHPEENEQPVKWFEDQNSNGE